jgi:UDPglucose 6-dehydrogenase
MKICMIGTGYVGLVTGACFAENGNEVVCLDIDREKIAQIQKGKMPIYEPGLDEMVRRNRREGRIKFSTNLKEAIKETLFIFIAVGTPPQEDGSADLTSVLAVAREIGQTMKGYKVVVTKSTVPVGTTERVKEIIQQETREPFDVASNPEFLKEGAALDDFMRPDRVVVGVDNQAVGELMKELYAPFVRTGKPILIMDIRSSELTKYAANAMLATRISFMNEMANLCERLGTDINMLRKGIGSDPRIGPSFLFPGVGYGGSCFPKDVNAIIKAAEERGYELRLLKEVERVNQRQKEIVVDKVIARFGKSLKGKNFAVWGLSFKPNTDDIREAPSIVIINRLMKQGAKVRAYDPVAISEARKIFGDRVIYGKGDYDILKGADALIIITEWNEFREPDFDRIKKLLKNPVIFDGRNIYNPSKLREAGFEYYGIGY